MLRDPRPLPPVLPRSRTPSPDITSFPQIPHPLPATARSRRPPAIDTPFLGLHIPGGPSITHPPHLSFVPPDTHAFDRSLAPPPFPSTQQGLANHHPWSMSSLHSFQAQVSVVAAHITMDEKTFAPATYQDPEHLNVYDVSRIPPVQYVSPDVLHSSPDWRQRSPSPDSPPPPPRRQRLRVSSTLVRNSPLPSLVPELGTSSSQTVTPAGRYNLRSTSKAKNTEPLADETNIPGASGSNTQPKPAPGKKRCPP